MRLSSYMFLAFVAACGGGGGERPSPPVDGAAPEHDAPIGNPPIDGPAIDGPPIDSPPIDSPPIDGPPPPETRQLGMNDVSMFFLIPIIGPLVGAMNGVDGNEVNLVPRDLFARLVTSHVDIAFDFEEFQIFALRFDLCDRLVAGTCPEGVDGSLRLVFQPLEHPSGRPADVGVHAFYTIPAAEIGTVVNQLRAIARVTNTPRTTPLRQRGFDSRTDGALIKAFVASYARADRLIRLSLMGQDPRTTESRVIFRGIELQNGAMVDMAVATTDATQQTASLIADADPSYAITPVADSPAGFALTLNAAAFNAAAPADQRSALEALAATQNPLLQTAATVQCIACHTSSYVGVHRGVVAGIDITSLANRYTSTFSLSLTGGVAATEPASLHAFSWFGNKVGISQRVVNETAQVLKEIEARFPVP